MSKKRSVILDNIVYFFFWLTASVVRILPLSVGYAFADFASWCVYHFDFKHSRRAVAHVLHSGIRTDRKEAQKIARESFRHLLKVFIEIVKFDQFITKDNIRDYIRVADDPVSQRLLHPETSHQIILATAHLGNWELAGGTNTVLSGIPMTSIMRPLGNPKIGQYIYDHRMSFTHKTISKEKGLRPLLTALKEGVNVTFVADQHASSTEGVEVQFFGHPARAHASPALLHLRSGVPIAMPYLIRLDNHFHFEYYCEDEFVYTPTGDKQKDIQAITQQYTDIIERAVRKFPEQWLWSHRRWLDCNRKYHPSTA